MNDIVKKKLKKSNIVVKLFRITRCALTRISPTLSTKFTYRVVMSKKLDLVNPTTFNEKIQWLKLNTYYNNSIVTKCVDKYLVREYVKEQGCEELLNELIGVYSKTEDIDWNSLPNEFVIKCNHGCGYNIVCNDKSELNKKDVLNQIKKWLAEEYYLEYAEVNYKNVPKKIIIEKYLRTEDGFLPNDYKIYCFNGKAKYILTCLDREEDMTVVFHDVNWQKLDYRIDSGDRNVSRPKSLDKMIAYCEKLARGFPFVRMDFYEVNGAPILGEMTFTPAGGLSKNYTDEALIRLGEEIELKL